MTRAFVHSTRSIVYINTCGSYVHGMLTVRSLAKRLDAPNLSDYIVELCRGYTNGSMNFVH